MMISEKTHHLVHVFIREADLELNLNISFDDFCTRKCIACCSSICFDETGYSKLSAAKIPDYDDKDISQVIGYDLTIDGLSCGS